MDQFDRVTATFRPARTDDLRPGVAACVGMTLEWEAVWPIEDGPHAGRWAMRPVAEGKWPFCWAPDCDLEITGRG
jgi:hypothetical protein